MIRRPGIRTSGLRAILVAAVLLIPAAGFAQTTALFIDSQAGDTVGIGERHTYLASDGTFSTDSFSTVRATFHTPTFSTSFTLEFSNGTPTLSVGSYQAARRTGVFNRLSISSTHDFCSLVTGRFDVREIEYGSSGSIVRFAADFEQHCEGADPALYGAIRFNSTISDLTPFGGQYPLRRLVVTPPAHGSVTGGAIDCGGAGTACQFDTVLPQTFTLTATPDPGFIFTGWGGDCFGVLPAAVRVNGLESCAASFEPEAPPALHTALYMESQTGDGIGGGATRLLSPVNSVTTVRRSGSSSRGVAFSLSDLDGRSWSLEFDPPASGGLLAGTTYAAARRPASNQAAPGLGISSSFGSCSNVTGRFVVLEFVFSDNGTVERFAADFEQHCNGADAALFGAIRYNSTISDLRPFAGQFPLRRLVVTAPANGRLTGGGIDCGGAGAICQVDPPSVETITLAATPDPGFVFTGWGGDCFAQPGTVRVNGFKSCTASFQALDAAPTHTALYLESQPGDSVGGGLTALLSPGNSTWSVTRTGVGNRGVAFSLTDVEAGSWSVQIEPPPLGALVAGTTYAPVRRPGATALFGGLNVAIRFNSCFTTTGRVAVLELQVDASGAVQRFAADFEQRCNGSDSALFGAIRYNSTISELRPFGGQYPLRRLIVTPPANGRVTGGGIDCGGAATACQVDPAAIDTLTLNATPDPGFIFTGWGGECFGVLPASVRVNGYRACVAQFEPVAPPAIHTALFLDSRPATSAAVTRLLSPVNSIWTVSAAGSGSRGVTARLNDINGGFWAVTFEPPSPAALTAGITYSPVRGTGVPGVAGLDVSGNGIGCSVATGRFVVLEIARDSAGAIVRFAADFEQVCSSDTALYGAIRYNSTVADLRPFAGEYPIRRLVVTPPSHGRITGGGIDCGGAGTTCQLDTPSAATITLTATPDSGFFFTGWGGDCGTGLTAQVRVNGFKVCSASFAGAAAGGAGLTMIRLESQAGDFVGKGTTRLLSLASSTWTVRSASSGKGADISVTSVEGDRWSLQFLGPFREQLVEGQTYLQVSRFPFENPSAGLDVSSGSGGCGNQTGRFTILEFRLNPDGSIARFAADFEQHCEGGDAALFGIVRFNSTVTDQRPFAGAYPRFSLGVAVEGHGRVSGPGIDCSATTSACTLTFVAPFTAALTATPDAGYLLAGWTGNCHGGETISLRVNGPKECTAVFDNIAPSAPRTRLEYIVDPMTFRPQGRREVYSTRNSVWSLSGSIDLTVEGVDDLDDRFLFFGFGTQGADTLQAGRTYTKSNVSGAPFMSVPDCSGSTGFFTIRQLVRAANGTIDRLAMSFEQSCSGQPGAAVHGTIEYNATIDIPVMTLDRTALTFGAESTGAVLARTTPAQAVRLTQTGAGAVAWTATSNQPWLVVSPASGSGTATLMVGLANAGAPLSPIGTVAGSITLTYDHPANPPARIDVTLQLHPPGTTSSPQGLIDTPLDHVTGVTGAVPFTGWALDDIGVSGVTVCRAAAAGEPAPLDGRCNGEAQVFVGNAVFIDGARPDVMAAHPDLPIATRAGWGFMVLTNMLPNLGNGTFSFFVYATDTDGHTTVLGTRTLTCDNAHAAAPFGAIDTPGQGEIVTDGVLNNFGWVLSPNAMADPPDGGTVTVFVDGVPVGTPFLWTHRVDIDALFPASLYPGVPHALGVFGLDVTALANGLHTIAWGVTDNLGRGAGVGSRFFTVSRGASAGISEASVDAAARLTTEDHAAMNTEPLLVRRGYALETPFRRLRADAAGRFIIRSEELDRVEVHLGEIAGAYTGYLRVGASLAPLPIGSTLSGETFLWQPGVGFSGTYDLVFTGSGGRREVRIILDPKGSGRLGPQVLIDTPRADDQVSQPFLLGGWAADLDSEIDRGVDTVHVWAYPVDGGDPLFVGAATDAGTRPDVAAVYGARFRDSGYGVIVQGLPPGTYDLAVFAYSTVAEAFAPARVVRVTIR